MNEQRSSAYLEKQFLIAMPQMVDPFFSNTVTYLWKHSPEGALGIVINKPLSASIADVFDELSIDYQQNETDFNSLPLLAGGPVEKDKGFIIHDAGSSWESSITITPDISICTSRTILEDIAAGNGPGNYLVALGCAGWEAGQLEKEITDNAWLTTPATPDLIFSIDFENKASEAAAILGINLDHLSPAAGHS